MFAKVLSGAVILVILLIVVLAAVYFFAIRPIIDTADDALGGLDSFEGISQEIQQSLDDAGLEGFDLGDLNVGEISEQQARKLARCIDGVQGNAAAVQDCAQRFR